MPDIRHEIVVGAPAEKIFTALTTQKGLAAWWTPDTQARPEEKSIARFGFGPVYFKEMKILELTPARVVKWICMKGVEEWVGTNIVFELLSGDRDTLLNKHPELKDQIQQQNADHASVVFFRHDNWKAYTPMFSECNYTWAQFLRSLKLFCETGRGRPWPDQHSVTSG